MAKCKKKDIKIKKYWPLFTLLLPALIYTIIFCYGPMYGIIIAFNYSSHYFSNYNWKKVVKLPVNTIL